MSQQDWLAASRSGKYLFRKTGKRGRRPGVSKKTENRIVSKAVNKALTSDVHYFDNYLTDTGVVATNAASGWFAYRFMNMAQNDDQQGRTGKKILLHSLALNMSMYRNNASGSHDRLRIVVVQIRNGDAVPTSPYNPYPLVYDTTLTAASVSGGPQMFRTIRNGQVNNFKILKDYHVDLGYLNTDKSTKIIRYYKRFKKPLTVWYDTSSTAAPVKNEIVVLAVSDSSADLPLLSIASRITFSP